MKHILAMAAAAALAVTAGCGSTEQSEDGLSTKERSDLDNAAAMIEGNQIIDTSADSLVLEDNAADPAVPTSNGASPVANGAATANQAAPR